MAGELRHRHPTTGATIYAHLMRASDSTLYNGSTFETPAGANWGNYDVACPESSTTQYHIGNMPAVAAGLYDVWFFLQAGGSPATTDMCVGKGEEIVIRLLLSVGVTNECRDPSPNPAFS